MHLVRTLQRSDRSLAQPDVADFTFANQVRHGANHLFDRHFWIHAMLVIKIYHLNPKPLQAAFYRTTDILRPTADAPGAGIGRIAQDAKFGGQEDLLPFALDRFTNQPFVGVRAVHVGGVQQGHPQFQCPVQCGDGLFFILRRRIEITHPHAAQPQGRNGRAIGT
ncbi:hypothetical protein D3C75_870240 [compost metagenome]